MSEPYKPHKYQKKAMKFLLERAAAGLLLDPGLGKTSITLGALKILMKQGVAKRALIVAPLRVIYEVWPLEIARWTDFNHFRFVVLHGPKKDQLLQQDADIYLINPEGLDWLMAATKVRGTSGRVAVGVDLKRWKAFGFDTLVIDELSKFKHISSNRFKAVKAVMDTFGRRWGLTGSPASNGLEDLFGQCYILDGGRSLGRFITHFRAQYFVPNPSGFGYSLALGAQERIYDQIRPLMMRMSAEDYLELPELVERTIEVELPPKIRQQYDQLENELLAMIGDMVVTAATAGIAAMKCRQIISGGIYNDPGFIDDGRAPLKREWTNLHTLKVDALAELIDELQGSPLLVAYHFQHDLDRLRQRFGKDAPVLAGSPAKVRSLVKEWNSGRLPFLFAHPMSAGHGLNLQESAHHVAWHTLTHDYDLYDQFNRRVRRQGNKSDRVFIHHIVARKTIDQQMLGVLRRKEKNQDALFKALSQLRVYKASKAC